MQEQWLNLETSVVCIDAIAGMRKARLGRVIEHPLTKDQQTVLMHGILVHFKGGGGMELDYEDESHRDQVYDVIWSEIRGHEPDLKIATVDENPT